MQHARVTAPSSPSLRLFPEYETTHPESIPEQQDDKSEPKSSGWISWSLMDTAELDIFLASTCLKLLLFSAYRSTDFEVHRNWLAITHSLPISKWYYDTTSEWTLDYPPFFAYFEKIMSIPAYFIDPRIVDLNNLNYNAWSVVAYQRSTVIMTELVLGAALLRFIRGAVDPSAQRIISASLFLHPGFLIVDHLHFQYNGFMFGILLWSILMARNDNKLASGFLFAVLLNFKHIYMYLAPAYFIYLLRSFCLSPSGALLPARFISLANAVILVFLVSLGPFLLMGQLPQLLSRLFPFTRGLNHAYWAPNFWALVTASDRVLLKFVKGGRMPALAVNMSGVASTSRGLVGDTIFAILPNVKPIHTFIITIVFQVIYLVKLWKTPTYKSFLTALTLCGYTSFMFGWHVHEKAVLLVLVPFSLLAAENHAYFRTFMIASFAGIFSLFPLLFTPMETLIKVAYSTIWAILTFTPLHQRVYEFPRSLPFVIIDSLEKLYVAGFVLLQLCVSLFPVFDGQQSEALKFLPLMLTSVYCATGLVWAFMPALSRTSEFRAILQEKQNEIPETKRRKITSRRAADGQREVQDILGKEYLAEAYLILQHINSLTRMLSAVRRPYLNLDTRPSPLSREPSRNIDLNSSDQSWANIRHLTNEERDQIDLQARVILSRCADRVKRLEAMEKQRAELAASRKNPIIRLLPARLRQDDQTAASDFIAAHHSSVTWYLSRRLTDTSQTLKDMQEERMKRQLERTRTLGSGAAREAMYMDMSGSLPSPAESPASGSWLGNASNLASSFAASISPAENAHSTMILKPPSTPSDDFFDDTDEEDMELTASQIMQFETENANILQSVQDTLVSVQQAESRLMEISALQMELVTHLTRQTEQTEQLYEDAIATAATVEKGNVQLKEARRRARDSRKWILLFLIGASLSLLFLHYY
ncbi:uncharacterized protein FIBRA_07012 [Fibroporia radiculosa]|uniref:Dolichyl pyrophosphate Glc1Man9GlcNAc2 alpha-1,3-glucosyltransferase n=1 Tax=Fibroporia radiculosa TaxID=599839 RepID=J4H4D8_9APHY|nr:uncharacterized protein FIBRA_07012 [Fibroporia radiculosa]CCM04819.1 predicted protein [Fibroporia radiculosa]